MCWFYILVGIFNLENLEQSRGNMIKTPALKWHYTAHFLKIGDIGGPIIIIGDMDI